MKIKNIFKTANYTRKTTDSLNPKEKPLKKGWRTNMGKSINLIDKTNKLSIELQEHFGEKLAISTLLNEITKILNGESVKLSIEKLSREHRKKATYLRRLTSRLQSTSYEQ